MEILNFSQPSTGSFLVAILAWLVQISSSIALGVVLFTLLLKLITLPFDYVSRAFMRKNSLKMEEMRPELEKLQKQYANDKALYQQKMMALYKKNGYSMFGACLPTIITLVIFIVALNAFTSYSHFQNKQYFYNMSKAYNNVVYSGMELDASESAYITRNVDGEIVINGSELYKLCSEDGINSIETTGKKADGSEYKFSIGLGVEDVGNTEILDENGASIGTKYTKKLHVDTTNSYIKATMMVIVNDYLDNSNKADETIFSTTYYYLVEEKLTSSNILASEENNYLKIYKLDAEGKIALDENGKEVLLDFNKAKQENENLTAEGFILDIRQQKSADKYHEENASFLWVKNIWVTDSPFSHPVEENWESFKSSHEYDEEGHDIGDAGYANLTAKLAYEKDAPNGYFILVVLTAGTSLLMQLVTSKSQKAQMELQTVDGQGAQTQKMMTIIMPIMMAVFAFMYTSAFSIYIILSSVFGLGTTIGINKIVDRKFKKEKAKTEKDSGRIRGRVYTPKQEEIAKQKEENKKQKKEKKKVSPDNDFLSGKADGKKHVRGRIK